MTERRNFEEEVAFQINFANEWDSLPQEKKKIQDNLLRVKASLEKRSTLGCLSLRREGFSGEPLGIMGFHGR